MPVAEGVYWLRMPLPFQLDHINLWLLDDGAGWTLVDTGASAPVTRACWQDVLADGRLGKPVRRIIVTHFHPDHLGLARWLADRTGASVSMSELTHAQALELVQPQMLPGDERIRNFCDRHNAAHPAEFGYFCTGGLYREVVDGLASAHETLVDAMQPEIGDRQWRLMVLGGHAEGHVVLHCPALNVIIAGDQVLPTITSNVSKFLDSQRAPDPLGNYLHSFPALEQLPDDILVLPSHGRPFRGLHARIEQLRHHHEQTLDRIVALASRPCTAGSLVPELFPQATSGLHYMLAFGETRAHLVHLTRLGDLQEMNSETKVQYLR